MHNNEPDPLFAFLSKSISDLREKEFRICGPESMMAELKTLLVELGVAKNQLKSEAFGAAKRDPTKQSAPSTKSV